jgi:hypothetical protein
VSRDLDLRAALDRSSDRRATDGGRDMPRGGRAGTTSRRRPRGAEDARDALTQQLDLPRGQQRERLQLGARDITLRGSEVRTLATVGAFRIVDSRDLETNARDRWHGDLEHLRNEALIDLKPHVVGGERTALVTLTADGLELLERYRHREHGEPSQRFYSGLAKPREATHDAQLARLYAEAAQRLQENGAHIQRVVLDYELKREYQEFLQENNRQDPGGSGRPDRSLEEIQSWADDHHLPVVDGHVQFPDVRIEYERPDGRFDRQDLELATDHYNSRQIAAKHAAGFKVHRSRGARLGGGRSRRGGSPFDPRAAAKVLR